jgi:hypothetical protein
MEIKVEVPVVFDNIAPYGLNMGEGMRVPINESKTIFETIIRLTGSIFLVINPLTGSVIHFGYPEKNDTEQVSEDVDKSFVEKTGEKLPPGTIIKFIL